MNHEKSALRIELLDARTRIRGLESPRLGDGERNALAHHAQVCTRTREARNLFRSTFALFPAQVDLEAKIENRTRGKVDQASRSTILNISARGVGHPYLTSLTQREHERVCLVAHMLTHAYDTQ